MSHPRIRYLEENIRKKLAFSPVVAIQGARQTGKSFLCKTLLAARYKKLVYTTFDKSSDREFASKNPDTFLSQYSGASPLVIDEAQKVPAIFDAVKLSVDENKVRGQYLLLGSTEFSKLTRIRESLTGRMSKARLYPFTLAESLHKPFVRNVTPFRLQKSLNVSRATRIELLRYLERGGFPGIFAVHNPAERIALIQDWIDLTVERDVHTFPRTKVDSDLIRRILEAIATLDHPDTLAISKRCGRSARTVQRHLEVLETLFVIERLNPHPLGTGKPIYFICDVAVAGELGASFERKLSTWVYLELLAQRSYENNSQARYSYYRTAKGSIIDFIQENRGTVVALKIIPNESFSIRDTYILQAFTKKSPTSRLFALAGGRHSLVKEKIEVFPWEAIA